MTIGIVRVASLDRRNGPAHGDVDIHAELHELSRHRRNRSTFPSATAVDDEF